MGPSLRTGQSGGQQLKLQVAVRAGKGAIDVSHTAREVQRQGAATRFDLTSAIYGQKRCGLAAVAQTLKVFLEVKSGHSADGCYPPRVGHGASCPTVALRRSNAATIAQVFSAVVAVVTVRCARAMQIQKTIIEKLKRCANEIKETHQSPMIASQTTIGIQTKLWAIA